MEMKISDVIDRYVILRMKARYDENAKKELVQFEPEINSILDRMVTSKNLFSFLNSVILISEGNSKIWENEAAIRQEIASDPASKQTLNYEEIGRRAIRIRDYNRWRIDGKTEIDKLFGDIPDVKVNHASQ